MQQATEDERVYQANLQLAKAEYRLQRIHLRSRPRMLGLVLSNRCNIGCIQCYQAKNGDSLFAPVEIGRELRREIAGFYPYLSTLDVLGGEVFISPGFSELVDDVAASVSRPILRMTTNGTLIDEAWAERIVRTPFRSVTISIDGGTPATYAKIRRGSDLTTVLSGIRRIQSWKKKLGSELPSLDSFFVAMRSNFREIPQYLELVHREGIVEVALEIVRINDENTSRIPTLAADELISSREEAVELQGILRHSLGWARQKFRAVRVCGFATLFKEHGLDFSFLGEGLDGLYPDADDLRPDSGDMELCPNPWTTMFVTERGNVHLCFLSEPIGNLYEAPLAEIWNSPQAVAKRSRMISGRYAAAACDQSTCSWREGRTAAPLPSNEVKGLLGEIKDLANRVAELQVDAPVELPAISAVRRLVRAREQHSLEMESLFQQLCDTNAAVHETGRAYIDDLESELQVVRDQCAQLSAVQSKRLVQIAMKASDSLGKIRRQLH